MNATGITVTSQTQSLAAATTHDIYLPLTKRAADAPETLKAGKLFALIWGVVLTGGALLFPQESNTPVVVVALGIAGPAFAHVTVNPNAATQGGYGRVAFRVPNESDTASTVKLEVNLPEDAPVASVSTMPVPGWTVAVQRRTLATPLTVHGSQVTDVEGCNHISPAVDRRLQHHVVIWIPRPRSPEEMQVDRHARLGKLVE